MHKYFIILLLTVPFSCLSPDKIKNTIDTDAVALDQLLKSAITQQENYLINKTVTLDGVRETKTQTFDTQILRKDLKVVSEYSFARLIRSSNYVKTKVENGWLYERKEKEKNGPISVKILQKNDFIASLEVKFEDKNYLYNTAKKIELYFDKNRVSGYMIIGERKLVGMNSSSYLIEVDIRKS